MGRDAELLLQTVDAVQGAEDLGEVVGAVAASLRDRFDLRHVSAGALRTGSTGLTVLAGWSVAASVLTAGSEVATSALPALASLLPRAADPRAVHAGVGDGTLLEFLLRKQGVRQVTLQTVHRDDGAMVVLVLGSGTPELMPGTPAAFFAGLAAGIRPRVLELTHLPT